MKKLMILLLIFGNLFAGENSSDYITYDEFVKIKSYFSEDGCAGVEKFLQSSKDLNVSNELNGDLIQNLHYDILCLLAGSTDFTAFGGGKKADGFSYKNIWENKFPKDKQVRGITFRIPSKIMNKCKNKNDLYRITYIKGDNQFEREFFDGGVDFLDDTKPDELCIRSQLNIFKSKPRFGTIISTQDKKSSIIVYWNVYDTKTEKYKVPVGQKVRILGSIKNLSYVYYNKKTKGACDPLHMVDGCNSGWVDTSLIDEIQSVQPKILSFDDCKKSIQSYFPPKNDYETKVVRNLPYAIRGYIFQDKKVQKFYESLNWYVADKSYRPDLLMLSESEQQWIDQWK